MLEGFSAFAGAMGAKRQLAQSLARGLGPRGVHVCHFVVDGAVDAPDTLGRMLGAERFAQLKGFLKFGSWSDLRTRNKFCGRFYQQFEERGMEIEVDLPVDESPEDIVWYRRVRNIVTTEHRNASNEASATSSACFIS